jgi:rubrerythrin
MDKLKEALAQAFTGEAKAVVRLDIYAKQAEKEGFPQLAKLFSIIARSEKIHATRALMLLREVKTTEENLADAFEKESHVAGVAYEQFLREAEGNPAASLFFSQSRDVEEGHGKLYKEAMGHLMAERETSYYLCLVCGFVADQTLPAECPVCGAQAEFFEFHP